MKTKKDEEKKESSLTLSPGEQFWEDLINAPYSHDKVGQSFVILKKNQSKEKRNPPQEKK